MSVNKQNRLARTAEEKPEVQLNADGFVAGSLVSSDEIREFERKQRREAIEKQAAETAKTEAS